MIKPVCTNCGQFKDEHSYGLLRCPLPNYQWHPENFYKQPDLPEAPPGWTRASEFKSGRLKRRVRYRHKRTKVVIEFQYKIFETMRDPQKFLNEYCEKFLTPRMQVVS